MPIVRCACPGCRRVMRVPDDIEGKRSRCPGCGAELVIRAMGGKTILSLAGVDGATPTGEVETPAVPSAVPSSVARPSQAVTRPAGVPPLATGGETAPPRAAARHAKAARWRWGGKVVALFVLLAVAAGGVGTLAYHIFGPEKGGSARARRLYQEAVAERSSDTGTDASVFALLDEAIADSPDFAEALAFRAELIYRSYTRDPERLRRAVADAKRAVDLDPDNVQYRTLLRQCATRLDDLSQQP